MIRSLGLAFTLASMPVAAEADILARYGQGADEMIIEVDEGGAARLGGVSSDSYSLLTASGNYVVFEQDGAIVAASYKDFHAALTKLAEPIWEMMGGAPEPAPETPTDGVMVAKGSETVAGYPGTRYEWDEPADPSNGFAILSTAPELKPLGRPLGALLLEMPNLGEIMGGGKPPAIRALAERLEGAALLKLGNGIALTSVEAKDIPDERFALPARILTVEEVTAMLDKESQAPD